MMRTADVRYYEEDAPSVRRLDGEGLKTSLFLPLLSVEEDVLLRDWEVVLLNC